MLLTIGSLRLLISHALVEMPLRGVLPTHEFGNPDKEEARKIQRFQDSEHFKIKAEYAFSTLDLDFFVAPVVTKRNSVRDLFKTSSPKRVLVC